MVREANDIVRQYPEVTMTMGEADRTGYLVRPAWDRCCSSSRSTPRTCALPRRQSLSIGATDCRFWRARGVPAYVYGCSPEGMGVPNEAVKVDEYLTVLKVHALAALDYLLSADPDNQALDVTTRLSYTAR